jgi:hypothetical protein
MLIQVVVEAICEPIARALRKTIGGKVLDPVVSAIGYALFGGLAGLLTLLLFPKLFIEPGWLRIVNLIVTPAAAGAAMAVLGGWRRRRGQELVRLDQFGYGFVFALALALARLAFAK